MTPLGPSEIAAGRRPFVVLAIATIRIIFGFCLAWPLASLVAESGIGLRGESDRELFEGGGYLLLELLRLQGGALLATARGLLPLLGVALLVGAACNAALLVALDVRERLTSFLWLERAWTRLPAHLVVSAGASLTKLLLLFLAAIAIHGVDDSMTMPVASTALQVVSVLPFVLLIGAVGGFEDIAKAALVRHDSELGEGLREAIRCVQRRPLVATFGWVPFALLLLLIALVVSHLTQALDVAKPGTWRVFAVFLLHQLVVVASVACRAGWFARALRTVAAA